MTDDVKLCPHCGKKLRADNRRGACSKCLASKGTAAGAGQAMPRKARPVAPAVLASKPKGTAVERFSIVAAALGFDGRGMLEQYAQTWLDGLKNAWLGALEKAGRQGDDSPAPVKHRQPAPVPVRLQPARTGEDRQAADARGGA